MYLEQAKMMRRSFVLLSPCHLRHTQTKPDVHILVSYIQFSILTSIFLRVNKTQTKNKNIIFFEKKIIIGNINKY